VPMIAATSAAVATIPSLRIAGTSLRTSLRSSRISLPPCSSRSKLLSSLHEIVQPRGRPLGPGVNSSSFGRSDNGTTSCEECPARSSPDRSAAVGRGVGHPQAPSTPARAIAGGLRGLGRADALGSVEVCPV
jgi:hypothetical protein